VRAGWGPHPGTLGNRHVNQRPAHPAMLATDSRCRLHSLLRSLGDIPLQARAMASGVKPRTAAASGRPDSAAADWSFKAAPPKWEKVSPSRVSCSINSSTNGSSRSTAGRSRVHRLIQGLLGQTDAPANQSAGRLDLGH